MELLERIRFITNSEYISDLACNRYLTFYQFHEIEEINIDDYSLKEWNDAAKYVSNQNKEFNNRLDEWCTRSPKRPCRRSGAAG